MDFNTGSGSGGADDRRRPPFEGETGGPRRGPAGSPGTEFTLQDPVNSFVGTVQALVLNPVGFFRGIAKRGDYVNPLVFALICGVINGVLGGILAFLYSLFSGDPNFETWGALAALIGNILLTPLFTLIGLFVGAGIFHLLVLLFVRPTSAGFEATFRVVSYASATQLISWIPLVGGIVAAVYNIVLSIFGIREVHATTTGRAALVVLIPVVVFLVLLLLLGAALIAILLGSQQQL
jgi:hypothetical protein